MCRSMQVRSLCAVFMDMSEDVKVERCHTDGPVPGICLNSYRKGSIYMEKREATVLCGASAYEEKYYLNPKFAGLPEHIRQELQILCVLYTQKVGGVLMLEFSPEGDLQFKTEAAENDFSYDEIGSVLEIKALQREKRELLESLEMYYRVFFLGEKYEE